MIYEIYNFLLILSYILYFFLLIGLSFIDEVYYNTIVFILQIIIAGYILIKFRPASNKNRITDSERKLIFASGFYLLISALPIYRIINDWSVKILKSNKWTEKWAKYFEPNNDQSKEKDNDKNKFTKLLKKVNKKLEQ